MPNKPPAKPTTPVKPIAKPAIPAKPAVKPAPPVRVAGPTFGIATPGMKPPTPVKPVTAVVKPVVGIVAKPVVPVGAAGAVPAPKPVVPVVMKPVPVAHPAVTPDVKNIRYIDPNLARQIVGLRPPTDGVPRDQIKVPICPTADVTDEVLFEDPAQPGKKFYLPRYKLATDHQRYRLSFQQEQDRLSLKVVLEKFAAPSIASAAKSAQEIDHKVAVLIRFNQVIGNQPVAQEELSFQEVTLKDGLLTVSLHLDSLQQRDLLYAAISDHSFGTMLIARRAVAVAVPVPAQAPPRPMIAMVMRPGVSPMPPAPQKPQPPAVPLFRQADRTVDQVVDPKPFVFSPELHPYIFAGVTPASKASLELTRCQVAWTDGRTHSYYQDGAKSYLFYYLPDSFKIPRRPDGAHEPLISVTFGQATQAAELKATFSFIAVPYVSPKRLQGASEELKASITGDLPKGVSGPQFEPLLSAPDKTHFSLAYPGSDNSKGPFELRDKASVDLRSGIHDSLTLPLPQFQILYDALFSPTSMLLTGKVDIDLGADMGEEIPFLARLNDMVGDFLAYSDQPLTDGAAPASGDSGDASASDSSSVGDIVTKGIQDGMSGDVGAVIGDVVGGLLNRKKGKKDKKPAAPPPPPQNPELGVQATLQNIIESPVEIKALTATLVRNKERLPSMLDGIDLSQPIQIPPGQSISFNVRPSSAIAAAGPVHAEYELSGAHPLPDRDAIWNETLDPSAPESYLTNITVKTPASTFAAPSGDPGRQIASMVVDFDSGVSVELNSAKLEVKIDLPHPVVNYVLRKADAGEYRYKLTVVRASGEQTRDSDWRPPETTTVLFPAIQ